MKKWLYGAPLALCVVLLAAVLWQSQKLDALNTEISSLTAALEQQAQETSGLREQVEELQHSVPEGPALTDWSVAPVSVEASASGKFSRPRRSVFSVRRQSGVMTSAVTR